VSKQRTKKMGTGIYRRTEVGQLEEIEQECIDGWCRRCQFYYGKEKCKDKILIQRCWDDCMVYPHRFHLQRECPFVHKGEPCRCGDFDTIEAAFEVVGLQYEASSS